MKKWENVNIELTEEERRGFRGAIIVFALMEALGFIAYTLYTILR